MQRGRDMKRQLPKKEIQISLKERSNLIKFDDSVGKALSYMTYDSVWLNKILWRATWQSASKLQTQKYSNSEIPLLGLYR